MVTIDLTTCFPDPAPGQARGPLPKQQQFMDLALDPAGPHFIGYYGGYGCLAAGTLVDTLRGPVAVESLRLWDRVKTTSGYASIVGAFPKGKARLYRVTHERGSFVAHEAHHVYVSSRGYLPAYLLQSGDILGGVSPLDSRAARAPLGLPLDGLRLIQTAANYLAHCLECCHRYGQLPPAVRDNALTLIRALDDAPEYTPIDGRGDDLGELVAGDIRPDRWLTLLDKSHLACLQALRVAAEADCSEALASVQTSGVTPALVQSLSTSLSHHTGLLQPDGCADGASLIPYSRVLSTEVLEEEEFYYDIEVTGKGHYLLADGTVHHNSGKSLILCVTMLTQGILYGGEYVIGRLNMPELRRTTMKQFLAMVPKELLIEYRVADAEVHIRTATGHPAIFYFVGLDEPGKLDSLSLDGFAIDESSYVPEEAYLKLLGRLRGTRGLRKGIIVGNPRGHNWAYRRFVSKKDLKSEAARQDYHMIVAPSTENTHLPDGYIRSLLDTYSEERIARDIMGSFDSFEGMIYSEYERALHVVKPFAIPSEWTRVIGADHGYTNPAAFLWMAEDYDGNLYVYREFYQREWLIEEIVKGHKALGLPGVVEMSKGEKIEGIFIDPSTRARTGINGESPWDTYMEHMPRKWGLIAANNDVSAGIDRVKSLLKPGEITKKPKLFIFDTCTNLLDEIAEYKWAPLPASQTGLANEKEAPHKYKDHACDALRYGVMSRPELPKRVNINEKLLNEDSSEGKLRRELHKLRNPGTPDPFGEQY